MKTTLNSSNYAAFLCAFLFITFSQNFAITLHSQSNSKESIETEFTSGNMGSDILGCTLLGACNFNPDATVDDGSCYFALPNDQCANAVTITPNSGLHLGNNNLTCPEDFIIVSDCGSIFYDLWYSFVYAGGEITINAYSVDTEGPGSGVQDPMVVLYDGCFGNEIGCSNDQYILNLDVFEVIFDPILVIPCGVLTFGETYYIQAGGFELNQGFFEIEIIENLVEGCNDSTACNYDSLVGCNDGSCFYGPTNDFFLNPILISEGVTNVSNFGACINEGYSLSCSFNEDIEQTSVWYSFTTPFEPVEIAIYTDFDGTTNFDSQIGIFHYFFFQNVELFCDEDDDTNSQLPQGDPNFPLENYYSAIIIPCFTLLPETSYLIQVDGWQGDEASFDLHLEFSPALEGCQDPVAINYNPEANCGPQNCSYYSTYCENVVWTENFDSYTLGNIDPQTSDWFGWDGVNSNADVSDAQSFTPNNSLQISDIDDLVTEFNINEGLYELVITAYIPSGNSGGNYNIMHNYSEVDDERIWACQVDFASSDSGENSRLLVAGESKFFNIPYDEWFEIVHFIDIDNDYSSLIVDEIPIHEWQWSAEPNAFVNNSLQLGALDLYGLCTGLDCVPNAFYDNISLCEVQYYEGCTDLEACNYSSTAIVDDGNCTFAGCTDPAADNYDSNAGCDNGWCVYYSPTCSSPIWEQNFDSFTTGNIDPQTVEWFGWNGNNSGADVVDEFSFSENNSIHIQDADDLVSELNQNSGSYELKFYTLLNDGFLKGGYFNLMHEYSDLDIDKIWAIQVYFAPFESSASSELRIENDIIYFDIPYNNWFEVKLDVDIDLDIATLIINGTLVHSWQWSRGNDINGIPVLSSNLGAIDLFAACVPNPCTPDIHYDNFSLCEATFALGCTSLEACNYNPSAILDDGSCTFAPCATCMGDGNLDGVVDILDVLSLSSNFGCTSGCLGIGDANFDGYINIVDLLTVSSFFGDICE